MHLFLLYVFLQVFKFASSFGYSKMCHGGKVEFLPMGCEKVIGRPLIIEDFDYELTIDTEVGRILSSIKRITNGIIIRRNLFERFHVMKRLQYIEIPLKSGPLLHFEDNPYLISFDFQDLRIINGSLPVVSFWNDNFPVQMRKNNNAFHQLLDFIATAGLTIDPCSADYFDLYVRKKDPPSGLGYYLIAGSFGALSIVIIIDILWYTIFQYWWEQKMFKLELERENSNISKRQLKFESDRKWRLECLRIDNEEKEFMEKILKKGDPFYAPKELEKWAEQKKKEQEKERKYLENQKRLEEINKKNKEKEEEKSLKNDKKDDEEKLLVAPKKEKKKQTPKKEKSVKKEKEKKKKSFPNEKKSVKKVTFQEEPKISKIEKLKSIEEVLDQTQADEPTPKLEETAKSMKSDVSSNFGEAESFKKTAE